MQCPCHHLGYPQTWQSQGSHKSNPSIHFFVCGSYTLVAKENREPCQKDTTIENGCGFMLIHSNKEKSVSYSVTAEHLVLGGSHFDVYLKKTQ